MEDSKRLLLGCISNRSSGHQVLPFAPKSSDLVIWIQIINRSRLLKEGTGDVANQRRRCTHPATRDLFVILPQGSLRDPCPFLKRV